MFEIWVRYKKGTNAWRVKYYKEDIIGKVSIGTQAESDNSTLTYGPVAQYGSFTVYDKSNFIYDHIKNGTFIQGVSEFVEVEIYFYNRLIFKNEATISYSLMDKQISFEIRDTIQDWDSITYPGFRFIDIYLASTKPSCSGGLHPYPGISGPMCVAMLTGEEIYNKLKTFSESKGEVFEDLAVEIQTWLNTIKVYVPRIDECSLSNAWTQFCELSLTHLYRSPDGKLRLIMYD